MSKPRYTQWIDGEGWTGITRKIQGRPDVAIGVITGACHSIKDLIKMLQEAYKMGLADGKKLRQ